MEQNGTVIVLNLMQYHAGFFTALKLFLISTLYVLVIVWRNEILF